MNSVYGYVGATKGMLPCVPIAASVTATGRRMIEQTSQLAQSLVPGSRIVYGDSVAAYTPLIVRYHGSIRVTPIERLSDSWTLCTDSSKEYCSTPGLEVWSDCGWTVVHRVIRHKAGKPMVRVLTHSGMVDVTTDHSLLRLDGSAVTPREVEIGDLLMHADFPDIPRAPDAITCVDRARVMGFFCGDGSCDLFMCKLSNPDRGLLERYKTLCERAFPDTTFTMCNTKTSLAASEGTFADVCMTLYSPNLRDKVVPPSILGASEDIRRAFWTGMYDSHGKHIDHTSHMSAATIAMLDASLRTKTHTHTGTGHKTRWQSYALKDIQDLPFDPDAYVYDLTTANNHFSAGIGTLVVHNTDSVMVILNVGEDKRHDMHAHFQKAQWLADEVSKTFPNPVELEFEKVSLCSLCGPRIDST